MSLRKVFEPYFLFGSAVPTFMMGDAYTTQNIAKQYSTLTCENEMKPASVLDMKLNASEPEKYNYAPALDFSVADKTLEFAYKNGLKMRGHTLLWHNQTPEAFFHVDYDENKPYMTRDDMIKRTDGYIKAVMTYVQEKYPGLIYAWDVVNEAIEEDGMRPSNWTKVVGDDFVLPAFRSARKYAAPGVKLFYNDYNTFTPWKRDYIIDLILKPLLQENLVDGMGMQSHMTMEEPQLSEYEVALNMYGALVSEVHVTELDIHNTDAGEESQKELAMRYKELFTIYMKAIKEKRANITSVTLWGIHDGLTWLTGFRKEKSYPLLFTDHFYPKECYRAVIDVVNGSEYILDRIVIPNMENIKGNITLVSDIDGVKINWKSSNPDIVSDTAAGTMAAGVVKRGADDVRVILTASVDVGGKSFDRDFEVNVKKAPKPIEEDDYQGYLFGHFIGEENADGEQIYFAVSKDGLNFKDLNGCKPVLISSVGEKGVRDPYLYRSPEGDRYFLIATDLSIYHRGGWFINEQGYYDPSTTGSSNLVLWESDDLVSWGEPKLINVAPDNAGMAWAPEMIYNDETGEYIIFFSSSIMNPATKYKAKPNTIFYVATRDFVNFSDTRIFIDNQTDNEDGGKRREIIDTTLIKIGDYYYSASKDGDNAEANGGIRIMKTKNLLDADSWEKVLDLDELGIDLAGHEIEVLDNSMLEGPELFMYNKKDWVDPNVPEYGLMADQYALGTGYLPLKTTNIEDTDNSGNSWKLLSKDEYSFDKLKKRHGTIFRITKDELDRLTKVFL